MQSSMRHNSPIPILGLTSQDPRRARGPKYHLVRCGVSVISLIVYSAVEFVWKILHATLPAVVLPGAVFDVLLGMSWITISGVSLDATTYIIRHFGQEYQYKQISIPFPPVEVLSAIIYANEACKIPPLESAALFLD